MSYASESNLSQRVRMLDVEVVDEKVTHAAAAGSDTLKHGDVASITYINDATGAGPDNPDYTEDTDYQLTGDTVDWSLGGSEPTVGNAYYCTYRYRALTMAEVRQNLADADALINATLAGAGYSLPFTETPPLVRTLAIALAAFGCGRDVYGRTGQEIPERITDDYNKANEWLDKLNTGAMRLVYADGSTPTTTRRVSATHADYHPTFDLDPIEDSQVDPDRLDDIADARD